MPRIRTLKPEFFQDEKLAALDPLTRLVFLGLISQADDAGRLVDNVKSLDGLLFPMTDDTCADALDILARLSRITRYVSASGQRLIQIVKWGDHQKVDHPNKYVLPAPTPEELARQPDTESSRNPREGRAKSSRNPRATTNDLRPTTSTNDLLAADAAANGNWVVPFVETYSEHIGVLPHGRIGKALKPLLTGSTGYPLDRLQEMWVAFCRSGPHLDAHGQVQPEINAPQFCTPERFAQSVKFWEDYTTPLGSARAPP